MSMVGVTGRGDQVDKYAVDAERLSAALLEIEDEFNWDAVSMRERAVEIEHEAHRLGEDLLAARAWLCQANMQMRAGDIAGAAREVWKIHEWAADHDARQLQARTHLVSANVHRHLGDAAQCLEHSLLSVELLDADATPHMQIWHRAKLADALGLAGSMDAARLRYEQTEELAIELHQPRLLMAMLNNWAYTELAGGHADLAEGVARRLEKTAAAYGFDLDPAVLDTIGAIAIENGRYAEAEETMRVCIARHWYGGFEDADALAEYLLTQARARRGLGAHDRAQLSLDASRALCVERELGDVLVRVHLEQSELHAARGEFAEAFEVHKVFFAAHNALHSSQREAQARTRQAMFETTEARQEAERFREQARRDPLTGLRNRRYLDEQLPDLIEAGGELTVAIVDLDHFKRVNDQLSHDVGDQVLVLVAKVLETELAAVSPEGFVARMGGEEFLLVLPDMPVGEATRRLEVVRRAIRSYGWADITQGLPVTVSIGVAGLADAPHRTQPSLLSTADRNLYVAKHAGRDRVVSGAPRDGRTRSYRDSSSAA
jgi:diguanylate cyclase (GGDEF)-like protein